MAVLSKRILDISGLKFNRLHVVKYAGISRSRSAVWECVCDCGNQVTVNGASLRSGNTKSCGCLHRETLPNVNQTHGMTVGGKKERLYYTWRNMIERCRNKNHTAYKNYGGKGIKVCDEWSSDYLAFRKWAMSHGYDDKLTIDRINVDLGYSPENCRFVTKEINCKENKTTLRPVISSDGRYFERMSDAAKLTGARIGHIWSVANGKRKKAAGLGWEYASKEKISANT